MQGHYFEGWIILNFDLVQKVFRSGVGGVFTCAGLEIRRDDEVVFRDSCGWLDYEARRQAVGSGTLFDLASVSKLFVTTAFMRLVEQQKVSLEQPVCSVLPGFSGERPIAAYEHPLKPGEAVPTGFAGGVVDASAVTFRNLLAHNSGLPAWHALFREQSVEAAMRMALNSTFFYPTGEQVVYSDIGLILLGMAVEKISGERLDAAVYRLVTQPLGLGSTCYRPTGAENADSGRVAPTEFCAWRKRRLVGEVHDENAGRLGGIAGHAGLFSTASELAQFGQMFLNGGAPLLRRETVAEMTRLQAEQGSIRRGLGFALWSPDPENSSHAFSQGTFGHTGFTGTSIWIDPRHQLVVVLLTNRVYYGRDAAAISAYRLIINFAIMEAVQP